jgi:uncharacterized membrane protein YuzA (DUF378 family)
MFLGALCWGILGVFGTNVLAEIFGTGTLLDVVYTVLGVAGLVYVPHVLEMVMHAGDHVPHVHGT